MNTTMTSILRHLSPADFAALGAQDTAYIKAVKVDGQHAFAVHAADGTPLTVMASRDAAFAACVQNDMEPVSAH